MASTSREAGLSILGDISPGTHFCLFYETKEDLLRAATAYFKAGLENNEFCIWAVSEPLSEKEARNALSHGIPGFDRYLAKGSIEIVPGHEWYLDDDRFDLKRIIDSWREKLNDALVKGYKAMRVSGNAFWLGTKHWKDFCAYENGFQESFAGQPMSALCTYPLVASSSADAAAVVHAHQFAIALRNGDLEFLGAVKAETQPNPLTRREREVLAWVQQGKTAWEVSQILDISKRTVDEHVQTAIRKLDATNRTHAVAIALRDGLIDENYFATQYPAKKDRIA